MSTAESDQQPDSAVKALLEHVARIVARYADHYRDVVGLMDRIGLEQPETEPQWDVVRDTGLRATVMLSRTARHLKRERPKFGPLPAHDDPIVFLHILRTLNESFACITGIGFHRGKDPHIATDLRSHMATVESVDDALASPHLSRLLLRYGPD